MAKNILVNILVAVASLSICAAVSAHSGVNISNPVRSAQQDEITTLPGLNYKLNFKQYSGYLPVDVSNSTANRFFHYWFVESQSRPDTDPLVLWLNGGPGCSSMVGLFMELGPFSVNKSGQLIENKFSWNKNANILFLESPAGVGFSYALDGKINSGDGSTVFENYQALVSFYQKFPQFRNRSLYLAGESYGGIYVPSLAALVNFDRTMNLKGIAIGNGLFDWQRTFTSRFVYARYHGILGRAQFDSLKSICCNKTIDLVEHGLCNLYPTEITHSDDCTNHLQKAFDTINYSGINVYNIHGDCAYPSANNMGLRRRKRWALEDGTNIVSGRIHGNNKEFLGSQNPMCFDSTSLDMYLNDKLVKEAIHIPDQFSTKFSICSDAVHDQYNQNLPLMDGGIGECLKILMRSKRKLKILIYNGDMDLLCNIIGNEWFVDEVLNDKLVSNHSPWFFGNQTAGFIKQYEHLTWMTIKGAGHLVPLHKPAEALYMFENYFLSNSSIPKSNN